MKSDPSPIQQPRSQQAPKPPQQKPPDDQLEAEKSEQQDKDSLVDCKTDRVRANTSEHTNRRIDEAITKSVETHAALSSQQISERIAELNREWDTERVLETNATILALAGLLLGSKADRRWLWLPATVLAFLLQHATQGWCPPLPLIRRLGVRTRREIETEKTMLKFLRGDFDQACALNTPIERAKAALKAMQ